MFEMTKNETLSHIRALYRAFNRADHDDRLPDESWMKPSLAGPTGGQLLDTMLRKMCEDGMLTDDEHQEFYDTI
jgi:hypothetical protein